MLNRALQVEESCVFVKKSVKVRKINSGLAVYVSRCGAVVFPFLEVYARESDAVLTRGIYGHLEGSGFCSSKARTRPVDSSGCKKVVRSLPTQEHSG